jgi:tetratricopeptide (TPR) repeat protein
MKTARLIRTTLSITAITCACMPGSSQTGTHPTQEFRDNFDRSKEISAEALKNSRAGDSRQAIEIANTGLQNCPAGGVGSTCRGLLNYTLGYIYQQQAQIATTLTDRERALGSSAGSYRAALQDDPNNATVHFNLALLLINSGDQAGAIAELQQAVQADPTQWQYSLKLGDIQTQQKNWQAAMQAYTQAAQVSPGAEAPPERILELTRRGYGLKPDELQSRCEEWELLHPTVVARCYEQFIHMVYANNKTAAETALVAWLGVVAREEKVDEQLLEGIPGDWDTAALIPLRAVLGGELSTITDNWWTQSSSRREAWARFLLAIGQAPGSSDPQKTERIWQTALSMVKNDRGSGSSLELKRALALLYVGHPNLDPSQSKLNELVERIFFEKTGAIESNDLEAEQRYHAVLGLIFAGQQKWGSDGDPRGAAFQLRRTVEVAEERYRHEGIYQPLPEIKELRAKGYEKTNRGFEAVTARWDATLAYMDTDQLDHAAQSIEAFPKSDAFDKAALSSLLKLRRDAVTASSDRKSSLITELSGLGPRAGISQEFLQRQQFKALADLVTGDSAGAAETESVRAAVAAFSLTVDRHVPLIGVNDLSRWQLVQQRLVHSVGGRNERMQVRPGGGGATLKLTLPGSTVPQNVEVSPQSLQAAHVAQVLGPEKLTQYSRSITLSGGKLAVPDAAVNSPDVRQKLEMKGVKVTSVPQ